MSFRQPVANVFTSDPDHAIVVGTVTQGEISTGQLVAVPIQGSEVRVQVLGLQRFGAIIEQATVGQEIGMQLKGIAPTLIAVGSVVKGPLLAE